MSSGLRVHATELAITYSSCDCHESCDQPDGNQPTRTAYITCDVSTHNKDSGANHGSGDNHRGIHQCEGLLKGGRMFRHGCDFGSRYRFIAKGKQIHLAHTCRPDGAKMIFNTYCYRHIAPMGLYSFLIETRMMK